MAQRVFNRYRAGRAMHATHKDLRLPESSSAIEQAAKRSPLVGVVKQLERGRSWHEGRVFT
jgi:hypothetical protein